MNAPDFDMVPPHPILPVPKVSVCMITYNHQDFIGQAIDSILMQRTNFPFELVIGEDKSPDGTREVVLDYQRRYPEIVRLLLWRKNAGMMQNCESTLEACRGEYVAFCEGDDYWTDPEKLQRQVDLLDSHPEMTLCHHQVDHVTYEDHQRNHLQSFPPTFQRGTRHAADLIGSNFIQTCSVMIRRSCIPKLDEEFKTLKLGDWPMCYLAAENGDIGYIDRNMADYRVHSGNNWYHMNSSIGMFECARMAFYLSRVARLSDSRREWKRSGIIAIKYIVDNKSLMESFLQFRTCWRSRSISFSEFLSLCVEQAFMRFKRMIKRHPKVLAIVKRVFFIKCKSI